MKTPMEELIETFENALQITVDEQTKQIYLEKENQAIIEAYNTGAKDPFPICKLGAEYYKETFNK